MNHLRAGAVGYLNARPLVYGLERDRARISVRFDVPSRCATLLHEGSIDIGLIPSIEYLRHPDYYIVPDIGVVSTGPVASVALYAAGPVESIRSIALDSSSRTSVALLRVLCATRFNIEPRYVTADPDLPEMIRRCDAALLIGDPALLVDHRALGLQKIDLGEVWTEMTGLPFVYACWAGWPERVDAEGIELLHAARDEGVTHLDQIGASYFGDDQEKGRIARAYLKENIKYNLGQMERAGLQRFFEMAAELHLVPSDGPLRFYGTAP